MSRRPRHAKNSLATISFLLERRSLDAPGESRAVTRFTIQKIHAGSADTTIDISHEGGPDGERCGPYFDVGETYLVTAMWTGTHYEADQCSGTPISELSPEVKVALKPPE